MVFVYFNDTGSYILPSDCRTSYCKTISWSPVCYRAETFYWYSLKHLSFPHEVSWFTVLYYNVCLRLEIFPLPHARHLVVIYSHTECPGIHHSSSFFLCIKSVTKGWSSKLRKEEENNMLVFDSLVHILDSLVHVLDSLLHVLDSLLHVLQGCCILLIVFYWWKSTMASTSVQRSGYMRWALCSTLHLQVISTPWHHEAPVFIISLNSTLPTRALWLSLFVQDFDVGNHMNNKRRT